MSQGQLQTMGLLDHVYANEDVEIVMDIVDTYYSDHDSVYVSINP